jgi:hypothetical protein
MSRRGKGAGSREQGAGSKEQGRKLGRKIRLRQAQERPVRAGLAPPRSRSADAHGGSLLLFALPLVEN